MALATLKDVYIDQLQDIYSANTQAEKVTRMLAEKAKNPELKQALNDGVKGIQDGKSAIEGILKSHQADPKGEFCKGMEGLVKEAKAHGIDAEFQDDDARDAMIITQYQRMAHYGMAGYGSTAAFARRLGKDDEAKTLYKCLDETVGGDKRMTVIAETGINQQAAA
ncbi:DUF892 family protein [Ponticaulis sp.]|uniref:YciE/YciF ferroxidase family protein n=1 Tax=Ponticaulis sp. TaxID=2020902 RepID=UPI000B6B9120|nr:DUF892 family protein [Ponticaulis sp.]MAI91667.1 hypothetical protein [Ponticaulis sp.]OUX97232.1 MAG: hypothetical protein CBB65_14595 [Hyphomonadaceae bacterium TMED5]|tara:strand:- start:64567 stop:65064 length:498 start_codon:yes stop_codon:yes gene_type:complete